MCFVSRFRSLSTSTGAGASQSSNLRSASTKPPPEPRPLLWRPPRPLQTPVIITRHAPQSQVSTHTHVILTSSTRGRSIQRSRRWVLSNLCCFFVFELLQRLLLLQRGWKRTAKRGRRRRRRRKERQHLRRRKGRMRGKRWRETRRQIPRRWFNGFQRTECVVDSNFLIKLQETFEMDTEQIVNSKKFVMVTC